MAILLEPSTETLSELVDLLVYLPEDIYVQSHMLLDVIVDKVDTKGAIAPDWTRKVRRRLRRTTPRN